VIGAWQDADNSVLAMTGDVAGIGGVYPQCVQWNSGQIAGCRGWSIKTIAFEMLISRLASECKLSDNNKQQKLHASMSCVQRLPTLHSFQCQLLQGDCPHDANCLPEALLQQLEDAGSSLCPL
jgi:hypothetical protein